MTPPTINNRLAGINLDECYVYVFIRQDLPDWQQLVHSNHATLLATDRLGRGASSGHPNLVMIGVADESALRSAGQDMAARSIDHVRWQDPDAEHMGLISLCTEPLTKRDRNKLHHYRPWVRSNNTFGKGKQQ